MDEKLEFLVALVFTITAAASVGAGEFSVFGVDLLDQIHTGGGFVLDYATLGSIISVGIVWFYNRTSPTDLDPEYQFVVLAMLAMIGYGSYEPAFAAGQELAVQLVLVSVSIAGYWAIAHEGR